MTRRDIPNLITMVRLLLVPPVVWLIVERVFGPALLLFVIAGASDGLDGYLAKRFGWTSELGGVLDPIADKFLMVSCFIALTALGLVPLWLTLIVVARDLIIVAGATAYHYLAGGFIAAPTLLSKINTGVQILVVLAVLGDAWLQLHLSPAPLLWLAAAMALASGAHYVSSWTARARRAMRH